MSEVIDISPGNLDSSLRLYLYLYLIFISFIIMGWVNEVFSFSFSYIALDVVEEAVLLLVDILAICTFYMCSVLKSCLTLCSPGTVAHQVPLSIGFPGQEYWSNLPFPPPEDLPDPGIEPVSPALQAGSLPLSHLGSPYLQFRLL